MAPFAKACKFQPHDYGRTVMLICYPLLRLRICSIIKKHLDKTDEIASAHIHKHAKKFILIELF